MSAGYIGLLSFELHFPENGSLKGKRRHLLHTKSQLERRYGATVAEVEHHELWQRSGLVMAVVRREAGEVERALQDAERFLFAQEYELVRSDRRLFSVEETIT